MESNLARQGTRSRKSDLNAIIFSVIILLFGINNHDINNHETRKMVDSYLFAFFIFTIDRIENCLCSVEKLLMNKCLC